MSREEIEGYFLKLFKKKKGPLVANELGAESLVYTIENTRPEQLKDGYSMEDLAEMKKYLEEQIAGYKSDKG